VQGVFAVRESEKDLDAGLISEAPLNPEYLAYKNGFQPLEWVKQSIFQDQLGYIPEPADTTHLKGKKVPKKALEAEVLGIADAPAGGAGEITSAPAMYDLRSTGRVSPVKNQGSCGSCWAFASYGSMESEALPGQLFDFSENNLKNTHGFDIAPCSGGNAQMATAYLARWSGAVAEAADPYVDTSTSSPTALPVQEHAQEILVIPGRSGFLDNDNIKAALQTTGALYTTMYYSSSYYNTTSRAYYYSGTSGSNHAVTIVGWDDTYSRYNFNPAAPGDGAFIIKNSWGTSFGNSGYFFLSYYDSKVGTSLTAFTGESAANYNRIYQYDPLGWISSMGYGSNTAWAANVFTATSGESLAAVGLSTNQVNTAYQVFIYTDPNQGPLSSAGPVSTIQGTIGIPGYHTVTLPTPVSLNAGQKFSVVVRFQTPNYNYPITIERPLSGYASQATASAGQSYISSTGTTWTDLTASIPNANACLKAFTLNSGTTAPVAAFSGTPLSGTAPLKVTFTDSSTGSITSRTWYYKLTSASTWTPFTPDGTNAFTFTGSGLYDIQLTVSGPGGSSTKIQPGYITVNPTPPPVAAFSGIPTSGTAPLTVQFTDSSTNTPTSWIWNFGDDGTATIKNPSHVYSVAGTYTVTLTATNTGGSNTLTKTGYITVNAAPVTPVAAFSGIPTSGTAPLTVQFTDSSTNTPTSWIWNFGDGGTATSKNPSHVYLVAGTYTVSLTVKNINGSNKLTRKNFIRVQTGRVRQK
jgi:C1A family cysteine protease